MDTAEETIITTTKTIFRTTSEVGEKIKDVAATSEKHNKILMWVLISGAVFLGVLIMVVLIWMVMSRRF